MTYAESIEFLYGLRLFGFKLGLENTRQLAAQAGTPQERLRFIHIAGTNGKGSAAAMLESIYRASGLRVGLYTSPHLVSFRERIQVNRQMISEEDVVRLVEALRGRGSESRLQAVPRPAEAGTPNPDASPTFFEFVTVLALCHFAEQRCDLVIWETGLGGRLDATNIVTPLASVITNIEPDHQRWLGHDLRSIATEKAGIIKPGVPVITATSEPEAFAVIQDTARTQASPLTLVTPSHGTHPPLDQIRLPLLGWHQRINAATALAAVQVLQGTLPVGEEAIHSGLETVRWAGRLQLLERRVSRGAGLRPASGSEHTVDGNTGQRPVPQSSGRILLDGAHNASGAASLCTVLQEEFSGQRLTLILGILEDKDWALMCTVLAPVAERVICVPVKSERGTEPVKLAEACRLANPKAEVTVMDSASLALKQTAGEPLTVVAGSLYLVGEALESLRPDARAVHDEQALNEWTGSPKV